MEQWKIEETLETLEPKEQKAFLEKLLKEAKYMKKSYTKDAVLGNTIDWVPAGLGVTGLTLALLGITSGGLIATAAATVALIVKNTFIFDNENFDFVGLLHDREYYTKYCPEMIKMYKEDIKYLKDEIKKIEQKSKSR